MGENDGVNPLYALIIEGSRDPITENVDPSLILPRTLIVPKDSGIQIVYSNVEHALARAMRFKEPFRAWAIRMVMADFKGMISISSERGAMVREFNTSRASIPIGSIQGQEVTDMDMFLYEELGGQKGRFKNNPKKKGFGIDF